jgi:hypothetical protein
MLEAEIPQYCSQGGVAHMNGTELSQFAELIGRDTVPLWLEEQIRTHIADILEAIKSDKPYTLSGPNGETVTFGAKKAA